VQGKNLQGRWPPQSTKELCKCPRRTLGVLRCFRDFEAQLWKQSSSMVPPILVAHSIREPSCAVQGKDVQRLEFLLVASRRYCLRKGRLSARPPIAANYLGKGNGKSSHVRIRRQAKQAEGNLAWDCELSSPPKVHLALTIISPLALSLRFTEEHNRRSGGPADSCPVTGRRCGPTSGARRSGGGRHRSPPARWMMNVN